MTKRSNRKADVHRKRIAKEIERLSACPDALIPRQSFRRLVNETLQNTGGQGYSIRVDAVDAVQCACEDYMTEVLAAANNLALYNNRDTVTQSDVRFVTNGSAATQGVAEEPPPLHGLPAPSAEAGEI